MKFDYDKTDEEERECVAFLSHMEGEPDKVILCIRNKAQRVVGTDDAALWMYYDGSTALYKWQPKLATKKLYEGDTITLTF